MGYRKGAPDTAGTLLVIVSLDFWSNRPIRPRRRVEIVRQVVPGMTRPAVEPWLGRPPGSYPSHRGSGTRFSQRPSRIRPGRLGGGIYVGHTHHLPFLGQCWKTETCDSTIDFEDGRAVGYFHEDLQIRDETRVGLLGAVFRLPPSRHPNTARRVVVLGASLIVSLGFSRRRRTRTRSPSAT